MTTINIRVSPKRYFPFSSFDDTLPPPKKLIERLTTRIKPYGYFSENIADSFYNATLEMGEVFSVRIPNPALRWHPAKGGTSSKFHGHLTRIFPELQRVSDRTLDRLLNEMRDREE